MPTTLTRFRYTETDCVADDGSTTLLILKSLFHAIIAFACLQSKTGTRGTSGAPPATAKWPMNHSCDGVTAGSPDDHVDRVTTAGAFAPAKLLRNTAGNAHSWAVIESPTNICAAMPSTKVYLNVDLGTASDSQINIYLSKTKPTGGTTTARPTAPDEVGLVGLTISDITTGANHKFKFVTDDVGNFHLLMYRTGGGGLVHTGFGVSELVAPGLQSTDLFPMVLFGDSKSSSRGAFNTAEFFSTNGYTGVVGATSRSPLNTHSPSTFSGVGFLIPGNGSIFFTPTTKNQGNGLQDTISAQFFFYNSAAPASALKGTVPDAFIGNAAENVGQVMPQSPNPSERENIGFLWLPNGGTSMTL
jgi:hypothetical protein